MKINELMKICVDTLLTSENMFRASQEKRWDQLAKLAQLQQQKVINIDSNLQNNNFFSEEILLTIQKILNINNLTIKNIENNRAKIQNELTKIQQGKKLKNYLF